MGFWEKAGSFAKAAGKYALEEGKAANERMHTYKDEMPSKSDRELARIVVNERSSSPLKSWRSRTGTQKQGLHHCARN
ncbi:hypothetical protein [Enterobacter kobei]|uniref:hypothetical protein n=1 Tax=Enterobacter kobei TaxID=208224 RepID=UPI003A97B489